MRFVCDGKAYDTDTMELVKLDDFATAIYVDHGVGEAFLQTWDDVVGVRIARMTDEDVRRLKVRFGWGERFGENGRSRPGQLRPESARAEWEREFERAIRRGSR